MAGAAVGHIDQTDEYSPLVASHRGIFVPYPQRRGPCIEIERPPHIDRTAHTGNGAERPHEEIARSQLADTEETRLLGLQFCGKTPLRTGPGVLHTRRQVVLLTRRGGAGIARSPELRTARGIRIPRFAGLMPLFKTGVRQLHPVFGIRHCERSALRTVRHEPELIAPAGSDTRNGSRIGISVGTPHSIGFRPLVAALHAVTYLYGDDTGVGHGRPCRRRAEPEVGRHEPRRSGHRYPRRSLALASVRIGHEEIQRIDARRQSGEEITVEREHAVECIRTGIGDSVGSGADDLAAGHHLIVLFPGGKGNGRERIYRRYRKTNRVGMISCHLPDVEPVAADGRLGTEIEVVVVRTLPLAHLYVDGQLPVGILGVAERQGILHPRFR